MPIGALRCETPHVGLPGANKEEKLVEVAVTRQFRLLRRQPGVLRQLPRRQRLQRYHCHPRFRGQHLQSLCCCRLALRTRTARETAKAHGFRWTQVEIALRKVNSAASFRDEGVAMTEPSAWIVNLQAGAGGVAVDRHGAMLQLLAALL